MEINNKLIIVEGQDNCGKSTLLRSLRNKINNPKIISISSSVPPVEAGNDWSIKHYSSAFDTILNLVSKHKYDVLVDRLHIGETCYGPKFRNADSKYIWELEEVVTNMIQEQTYLIVLTDDGESIISRDDGYSIEQNYEEFDEIRELFKKGFKTSNISNKKLIHITNDGWPNVNEIYDWIYK